MESPKRILIVDDEPDLCEIVRFNLEAAGFDTIVAYSAEAAQAIDLTGIDLILLDVMMPGMTGFELATLLRQTSATRDIPIIFLTALGSEDDTLQGFDVGGDDYITKPFSVKEMVARVKAVLNRSTGGSHHHSSRLVHNGLVADASSRIVTIDGHDAALTRTEFDILWLLFSNAGKVFTREDLINQVWPGTIVSHRTVDVHITRLRKKIEPYDGLIATRQGIGYCCEL